MKSQGLKLVVQIYLSCLLQATQTELFKLTEEDHHVRDSPPVITTMLDISRDIGVHWKLNSDMFPYFDKTRDIREFLEDRADISCTFKDWDQVDDNSEGIWALMNQEARPWCDDVPYFQFNSMAGLVYFRSLTIRYFVHGNVYFNISSGDFLHEGSIECEDGKCGKDFKEYTVNLAEDDDNRKSAFRLDFMIPEPDSVILIDKIWGEDKASTPTTIRPTTSKRFADSTTGDPAELTTTPDLTTISVPEICICPTNSATETSLEPGTRPTDETDEPEDTTTTGSTSKTSGSPNYKNSTTTETPKTKPGGPNGESNLSNNWLLVLLLTLGIYYVDI